LNRVTSFIGIDPLETILLTASGEVKILNFKILLKLHPLAGLKRRFLNYEFKNTFQKTNIPKMVGT
jgi:hypothetical protein